MTFSVRNESLEKVFQTIEKQTSFSFMYSTEQLAKAKPVTLTVSNENIQTVLQKCFADQPLSYKLDGAHIVVRDKELQSVSTIVRGKLISENSDPIAGATVSIKNTPLITTSDSEGRFVLNNVPDNAILIVSGAEFETVERSVGKQTFFTIQLATRVGTLDETIIIAYGKTNRRQSTGSVSKVSKHEFEKQPAGNVLATLQGRVAGLQTTPISGAPGANVIVQIRGRNSIANGSSPLYILDGVPFPSGTLNNGVGGAGTTSSPLDNLNPADIESIEILKDADATAIYGSRGANGVILITTKKGLAGKPVFNARAYAGMGIVTRKIDLLNTEQYLSMRREAFKNDGATPTVVNAPDLLLWDSTNYTDWQDVLLGETMRISNINLSLSGGSSETQFLIRSGYHKETTIMPGDFMSEKINGLISLNHNYKKWRISATASYMLNTNRLPREDISARISLPPNTPAIYNNDGSLNWANSSWTNPMSFLLRKFTNKTSSINANGTVEFSVFSNLVLKLSAGYSSLILNEHGTTPKKSFNPSLNSTATATFGRRHVSTTIGEPQVTYALTKGKHRVDAVVGLTIQQTSQQGVLQTGSGYASDDLLGSLRSASTITVNVETDTRYRYAGSFARVGYSFNQKYLATATVRRDGSSRFGPANRFATFGSFAAGYVFTKENLFSSQHVLSYGKLKASIGKTGNDQIGEYKYLDLYSPYSFAYQSVVPFYPAQLYNPAYGWEEVSKKEIGIDLGFLRDRLLFLVNYYHNQTSNQLVFYPLPTTTGYQGILKNLPAKIRNNGWEIEANVSIIRAKKVLWSITGNLTIPKNKLVAFDGIENSSYAESYIVGEPLTIVRKLEFTGVNPSNGLNTFRDFDANGIVSSPEDQQAVFNLGQRFYGGIQQNLEIGKFSISILFQFSKQPFASNYLTRFGQPGRLENQPVWVLDRWTKVGDVSSIQRFSATSSSANLAFLYLKSSDQSVSDASFIRLRNIYLTYNFLTPSLKRAGIGSFEVFIQGQNLVTITKYKGLDPETQTFLPPVKLLTAGVNFSL